MQSVDTNNKAVGLLYHDVVRARDFASTGFQGGGADVYKLDYEVFEQQVKQITASAGRPASLATDKVTGMQEPYLFTFDDGGITSLTEIAPLLEQHGHKAHFFIPTRYIGQPGFLTSEQICALHLQGHDIGSHSHSHPSRISAMTRQGLLEEWGTSKKILEDMLSKPVLTGSIPGGYYSRAVAEAASEVGIKYLFSSEPTDKPWKINNTVLLGRYSIRRDTPSQMVIKLFVNQFPARLQQYIGWNIRKSLKKIGGELYLKVRKTYFK